MGLVDGDGMCKVTRVFGGKAVWWVGAMMWKRKAWQSACGAGQAH